MSQQGRRFVTNLKVTKNNSLFSIDIPYNIDIANSKFIVSGVAGSFKTDGCYVNIACPELTIPSIYSSVNNSHNIIATTVLNILASKPTSRTVDTITIGYDTPNGINNQSAFFTIQLLDENGTLYADSAFNYVVISITWWNLH